MDHLGSKWIDTKTIGNTGISVIYFWNMYHVLKYVLPLWSQVILKSCLPFDFFWIHWKQYSPCNCDDETWILLLTLDFEMPDFFKASDLSNIH